MSLVPYPSLSSNSKRNQGLDDRSKGRGSLKLFPMSTRRDCHNSETAGPEGGLAEGGEDDMETEPLRGGGRPKRLLCEGNLEGRADLCPMYAELLYSPERARFPHPQGLCLTHVLGLECLLSLSPG